MILLDTHVLLWTLAHPERLGERTRSAMQASAVFYSAVSIAEISIKHMLGRLQAPDDVAAQAEEDGLQPLPLRPEHSGAVVEFPELIHHDPFDRLLLAQAHVERCGFLTVDGRLLKLGHDRVADARR